MPKLLKFLNLCFLLLSSSLILFTQTSCDPLHKHKCEWYLIPEPKHKEYVEAGWVSLCAKNYVIRRQKCFLKAKLDWAEQNYGKKFKLVDMELDEKSDPREITKVTFCEEAKD